MKFLFFKNFSLGNAKPCFFLFKIFDGISLLKIFFNRYFFLKGLYRLVTSSSRLKFNIFLLKNGERLSTELYIPA